MSGDVKAEKEFDALCKLVELYRKEDAQLVVPHVQFVILREAFDHAMKRIAVLEALKAEPEVEANEKD